MRCNPVISALSTNPLGRMNDHEVFTKDLFVHLHLEK
jgi:hypothetical protein